jgi:hypothetical protein
MFQEFSYQGGNIVADSSGGQDFSAYVLGVAKGFSGHKGASRRGAWMGDLPQSA